MLKFTPGIRKSLAKFYHFHHKSAPKYPENATDFDRLRIAKEFWLKGEGSALVSCSYQHILTVSLDGSAGGSGFLPPPEITKELNNIDQGDFVDYGSSFFNEEQTQAIQKYCYEEGILPKDLRLSDDPHENISEERQSKTLYTIPSYGTHPLFNYSVEQLIKQKGDRIIVPEPTYGLLLEPIVQAGGQIVPMPLTSKNQFKATALELENIIIKEEVTIRQSYKEDLKLLKGVFKNYDQHLDKVIKSLKGPIKKTNKLVDAINKSIKESDTYQRMNEAFREKMLIPKCPRIRAFFNINPHTPSGSILSDKEIQALAIVLNKYNLKAIDDLSQYNIYFDAKNKPGTFAKTSMAQKTITLISFSKDHAIAAVRAGLVLAPKKFIQKLSKKLFNVLSSTGVHVQKAIQAVVSYPKKQRDIYLNEIRAEYLLRRELVCAAIDGVEHMRDQKGIIKYLSNISVDSKPIQKKFQSQLLEGIPGLKLANIPDGTQFVLLDLSAYKDKYLGGVKLETSLDFRNAFYCLSDLNTIPGELNYNFKFPNLRLSLSMDACEICEALLRIKGVLSLMTDKPSLSKKELKTTCIEEAEESDETYTQDAGDARAVLSRFSTKNNREDENQSCDFKKNQPQRVSQRTIKKNSRYK